METLLAIAIGTVVAASVYLFLSRDLLRLLLGFILLGTGANLAILLAGRIGPIQPPLVDPGATALATSAANPLPQALILTAIVIGFGLTAFALMLVLKAHEAMGTTSAEEMAEAEAGPAAPPVSATVPARREAA
ncbi:multisubunit sodium/proton antiporter MrpC subunit [Stella humosa]|uniref:Multisubunit sodium/proton antiporter MrpC subunit n=1 Tax=Stella humosa TaxID=94 RepID=A0A3N1M9N4_9PROT|nr:NADH-quinone oxidoreductase subunit K [Stella humosa]ROQ00381.1 multisubunit sodium/proton antiporter MrpC subunit [Stella humosa]BBK30380.1 hypothetical protein STHU_10140 [Stella humosa]